jgi:hypothetical protein
MSDKFAFVEFDTFGPIRIFRTEHAASQSQAWDLGMVKAWNRARATEAIRRRVFYRDGWLCVHCGNSITWETGHLHERQHRGEILEISENEWQGGEVSLANSETRCYHCHIVDPTGHGKRAPQFGSDHEQV